ncbi:hypothetical protein FRC04_008777 [Tulasnella sp. 424]|nr:hypothetical protein FRC04_008777 [Tulasnella sp. 424]KAG8980006.1 hypothetical protein FRC05_007449 [Tulasnella sp. 425]
MPSLVGEIQERESSRSTQDAPLGTPRHSIDSSTGFPQAQHRSKSAFARAREARRNAPPKSDDIPVVQPTSEPSLAGSSTAVDLPPTTPPQIPEEQWRAEIASQNEKRVREMSDSEREREREDLIERFGPGIVDLMQRVKRRRVKSPSQEDDDPALFISATEGNAEHQVSEGVDAPKPRIIIPSNLNELPLHTPQHHARPSSPLPSALRSATGSPLPKTPGRKPRFSTEPNEVYVYESAPSSPKRQPIALLGAPDPGNPSPNQLTYRGPAPSASNTHEDDAMDISSPMEGPTHSYQPFAGEPGVANEEGTPEDIRKRFFPNADPNDPSLEWIKGTTTGRVSQTGSTPTKEKEEPTTKSIRYDLSGRPIPEALRQSLPTHLGLHHHGDEQDEAGYTLDELIMLSRSTVPAQRASMLGTLGKLLSYAAAPSNGGNGAVEVEDIRTKVLVTALEALAERGGVLVRAVEALWISTVDYARKRPSSSLDIVALAPLPALLRQLAAHLLPSAQELPPESLTQLLEFVIFLASSPSIENPTPDEIGSEILRTRDLIPSILHTFITSPSSTSSWTSSSGGSLPPNADAIMLVDALAQTSRANATTVVENGLADTFMMFVVVLPSSSATDDAKDINLAHELLARTLDLYATLGKYGMYAITATTAADGFVALGNYVLDLITPGLLDLANQRSGWQVVTSYLKLLEVWMTCAIDPHKTTPPHEILWSQVVGWEWASHVYQLRRRLLQLLGDNSGPHTDVGKRPIAATIRAALAAVWHVLAAWLEGSAVNSVKSGELERHQFVEEIAIPETRPAEDLALSQVVEEFDQSLSVVAQKANNEYGNLETLSSNGMVLLSAIRLGFACLPPEPTPPTPAPFGPLSESNFHAILILCNKLVFHPLWDQLRNLPTYQILLLRPLTSLVAYATLVARRCGAQGLELKDWLKLSFGTMTCLVEGEEDLGSRVLEGITRSITKDAARELTSSGDKLDASPEVSSQGGLQVILPFFQTALRRTHVKSREGGGEDDDGPGNEESPTEIVAPLVTGRNSIQEATTLRLPHSSTSSKGSSSTPRGGGYGLPLRRDWTFAPLDALLHSSTAPVFKVLPNDWDHSEVDVVRATLLLARILQDIVAARTNSGFTSEARAVTMSQEEVVFGCMKVFMLEHGQNSSSSFGNDSAAEVFRDAIVSTEMDRLLAPFRSLGRSTNPPPAANRNFPPSLERTALPYLGAATPFFQFYSDFLGLYDGVSFGHPTFGALLIPPLANSTYPIDYRKLLWGDYAHVLRHLSMEPAEIIGSDAKDWLYPVESDGELIGMYVKALGNERLRGFLRWVAVHHVASNIWPDLQEHSLTSFESKAKAMDAEPTEASKQARLTRSRKVLQAVLGNSNLNGVKEVVLYYQPEPNSNPALPPPMCFEDNNSGNWKQQRLEWVLTWGGDGLSSRLQGLLSG